MLRPFVDRPLHDIARATSVARRAAASFGLAEPQFVRAGMNVIFRADDVAIRVGLPTVPAAASLNLAAWLADRGLPVVAPAFGEAHEEPDVASGDGDRSIAATFWQWVDSSDEPADWEAVGAALATLHALDPNAVPGGVPLPLPWTFPWWDFAEMLQRAAPELDAFPAASAALVAAVERHGDWTSGAQDTAVLCHGDVHPGNVLTTEAGSLIIDWDLVCLAPPGWDHAPMLRWASHWGGPPAWYSALAAGYGRSFVDDPFAVAAADLRLVAATLMRVIAGRSDDAAATEAQLRLRTWAGAHTGAWSAQ